MARCMWGRRVGSRCLGCCRETRLERGETFGEKECADPGADLVADDADLVEGKILGVWQGPVFAAQVGDVGAGFAATHGDEQGGVAGQVVGEELGVGGREVDACFAHGFDDDGMDVGARVGAGGEGAGLRGIGELVEEGGGHLGSAGVVNAGEDVGLHNVRSNRWDRSRISRQA